MTLRTTQTNLFPYTTLFRSRQNNKRRTGIWHSEGSRGALHGTHARRLVVVRYLSRHLSLPQDGGLHSRAAKCRRAFHTRWTVGRDEHRLVRHPWQWAGAYSAGSKSWTSRVRTRLRTRFAIAKCVCRVAATQPRRQGGVVDWHEPRHRALPTRPFRSDALSDSHSQQASA